MNAQTPEIEIFDVFMCHNSGDKPEVREISHKLEENNVKPWLDEEQIRPGTSWQTAIGQQIDTIKSAAVFVGDSGFGPWQDLEIQALLSQFVKRQCPVIPVVLPSAKTTPALPWTMANLHWVDFRVTSASNLDPLKQLIWGITGEKPADQSHVPSFELLKGPSDADVKDLVPRKDKVVIEVRLPGTLDAFSDKERERILSGLMSLLEVGEVRLTRAMAGSIRLHLELKPEDADRIFVAAQNGQLSGLGISEARLYPAIAAPPDEEQRSQLLILLSRVKEIWVDGALRNSLYNEALISLGKRPMEEAVEPPWRQVVELPSQRSQLTLQDANIATIFDATGLLLILGEPGSGKTTSVLELAANLITRATSDAKERVPFVLNLSSWRKKQSLAEWICLELSEKYQVPVKIARSWLKNDYLVPLLDGLDEVQTALQPDCVAAINDFIDRAGPSGMVVCCRQMEYQWLPTRLKLNGAVCLEPLSSEEVSKYLLKAGSKLAALREAVDRDPVLQELTQTPLMLSVMTLTYQGVDSSQLARREGDSVEERRKLIFRRYVEQMMQRKETTSLAFPEDKVIRWLSWLAVKMREHSESVFLVEGLQPNWLSTRAQSAAYGTVLAFSFALILALTGGLIGGVVGLANDLPGQWLMSVMYGLVAGLIGGIVVSVGIGLGCWSESPRDNAITSGLTVLLLSTMIGLLLGIANGASNNGLLGGLVIGSIVGPFTGLIAGVGVGSLNHITLVETISWKWNQFWRKTIPGLFVGFVFGLILGLVQGFTKLLELGSDIGIRESVPPTIIYGLMRGVVYALIFCLVFGLASGLVGGLTDTVKAGTAFPNQGIKLSRENSFIAFLLTLLILGLVGGLIGGLIGALIGGVNGGLTRGLVVGLIGGLAVGSIVGLIVGLNRGGAAALKHYALRLILWRNEYTPLGFVAFLDHCARLILLKKVGGGYIFIHRMLLEYFAEIAPRSTNG